jgi:hypothetical protein
MSRKKTLIKVVIKEKCPEKIKGEFNSSIARVIIEKYSNELIEKIISEYVMKSEEK